MASQRILAARDANPLFEPCLLRLKIFDWLPQDDTFAFFTTCRAFQQTVQQHNQHAAARPPQPRRACSGRDVCDQEKGALTNHPRPLIEPQMAPFW